MRPFGRPTQYAPGDENVREHVFADEVTTDSMGASYVFTDEISETVDMTSSCMSFLSQLQSKANISLANVQSTVGCIKTLLADVESFTSYRVKVVP